jgi:ABC-type bacteriocin/lantibiotic exporter with double-glycine peptidase domain
LNIERAFTSYALLSLVNQPLTEVIVALPVIASSATSFQRIQKYLNGKEHRDNRLSQRAENDGQNPTEKHASCMNEKRESGETKRDQEATAHIDSDIVASIQGTFTWAGDAEPVIDISDWSIRARSFTLVLGPVGCGKSTLLKAVLGELSGFEGTIRTSYSRIGYCGQSAWLPNDTVRNIIVGGGDFDESWYRDVLQACVLEQDVECWPEGDKTVAGTMGISMSGGQRLRLVCIFHASSLIAWSSR